MRQIYLFTTFLVHVKSDANVQFFFSFALDCKDWVNAVFTIFASRANIIQRWNLPRGKYKQIWSNVVFTSYLHWFCSCCKSIFSCSVDPCLYQSICQLLSLLLTPRRQRLSYLFTILTLFSFSHWTKIKAIFRNVILSKTVEKSDQPMKSTFKDERQMESSLFPITGMITWIF